MVYDPICFSLGMVVGMLCLLAGMIPAMIMASRRNG